jgi:hypothetical protein
MGYKDSGGKDFDKVVKKTLNKRQAEAVASRDVEKLIRAFIPNLRVKLVGYIRLRDRHHGVVDIDFANYSNFPQHLMTNDERYFIQKILPHILEHGCLPD